MTTSTLHLNNPVPSNGAVVSSLGGRHTVTVTLAGVGAISCVVQAWGSEQGTDSRKIGAPVTVSGTTTVSQTLTFDADCKQFWLELVKLSPACKFNATVENDGSTSFAGSILAPSVNGISLLPDGSSLVTDRPINTQRSGRRLPGFSAAVGNVLSGIADAEGNIVGDSTTYGYYGTSVGAEPVAKTLKRLLNASVCPTAMGWVALGANEANRDPAKWTLGTGWPNGESMGFGGFSAVNANNPSGTLTFAAEDECDTFDVMMVGASGYGTATIRATGGAAVVRNLANATPKIWIITCTAAALSAANTVTVSLTGQGIFLAARARNSTKKQLYVNNLGVGSSLLVGGWDVASSGFSSRDALALTTPSFTFAMLGVNDAIQGKTKAQYDAALTSFLATFGGDKILATPIRSNPADAAGVTLGKELLFGDSVRSAVGTIADGVVDIAEIIGDYSATNYDDNYHLKRNKYPEIGLAYYRHLLA